MPRRAWTPALVLLVALPAGATAPAAPRDLVLAGGALGLCSDLAPRSCRAPLPPGGREPARYRIDAAGRAAVAALPLPEGVLPPAAREALLDAAEAAIGGEAVPAERLEAIFHSVCRASRCEPEAPDPARPWSPLLDAERAAVLAALQVPVRDAAGQRPRERSFLDRSDPEGGAAVLESFVALARERAGGRRPRIAFVTASALDPMDAVDAYASAFEALGAEAVWWPIDPALAATRFVRADCGALDAERTVRGQPRRAEVYPDLAAWQQDYCASRPALLMTVQGVFFAGGDQSRIRATLVGADGRPNPWGQELAQAWNAGRLVVGGTSAGAAVQSGAWMLANGSVEAAVSAPTWTGPVPEPGCGRAARCGGAPEDALTLVTSGGLGFAQGAIVDTHFSERARELRLLVAMQAAGARWGYGADEASALQVRDLDGRREIRAVGKHGGWVMRRDAAARDEATAWYLAPGATLHIEAPGTAAERVHLEVQAKGRPASRTRAPTPASAFDAGGLRAAAWRLAGRCGSGIDLAAGEARATLACEAGVRAWRSEHGVAGIGPLRLRLDRPPSP